MEENNIPTIGDETDINTKRGKKLGKILNDLKYSRKKIGNVLHEISTKKHEEIPLTKIFQTLEDWGLVVLQEDNTKWGGFLCGDEGQCTFEIGWKTSEYELNDCKFYEPINSTCLCLSWYRFHTGRYEITTYLS